MSDDDKKDGESTRAGAMRPPPRIPAPPSGATPPAGGENTGIGRTPPPATPRTPPDVAAEEPHEKTEVRPVMPPKAPEVIEEGTQIYVRPKVTLTRLGPPGHSGVIPLESGSYRLGRSSQCDIVLYSPSSSRTHAVLRREERGWVIEPDEGKLVTVDGESIKAATLLGHKSRLRLAGDDLLFLDESRAASMPTAPAAAASATPRQRSGMRLWVIVAAAAVAVAALLRFLLGP